MKKQLPRKVKDEKSNIAAIISMNENNNGNKEIVTREKINNFESKLNQDIKKPQTPDNKILSGNNILLKKNSINVLSDEQRRLTIQMQQSILSFNKVTLISTT